MRPCRPGTATPERDPSLPLDEPIGLLGRVRREIRVRHYSYRTKQTYLHWTERYLRFLAGQDVVACATTGFRRFLEHLAVERQVSAATQNQAFNALLFLYREVLKVDLGTIEGITRARRSRRLPVVLTRPELAQVFAELSGIYLLMAKLMFGTGMRLMECCRLRVKDVDFGRGLILVRDAKGDKDRVVPLGRGRHENRTTAPGLGSPQNCTGPPARATTRTSPPGPGSSVGLRPRAGRINERIQQARAARRCSRSWKRATHRAQLRWILILRSRMTWHTVPSGGPASTASWSRWSATILTSSTRFGFGLCFTNAAFAGAEQPSIFIAQQFYLIGAHQAPAFPEGIQATREHLTVKRPNELAAYRAEHIGRLSTRQNNPSAPPKMDIVAQPAGPATLWLPGQSGQRFRCAGDLLRRRYALGFLGLWNLAGCGRN
jgi:hypothetical protein